MRVEKLLIIESKNEKYFQNRKCVQDGPWPRAVLDAMHF